MANERRAETGDNAITSRLTPDGWALACGAPGCEIVLADVAWIDINYNMATNIAESQASPPDLFDLPAPHLRRYRLGVMFPFDWTWSSDLKLWSLEGTRPLLLEVQALTCPSSGYGPPRRNPSGIDPQRLAMLLAVLEKRNRIPLGAQDVYINLVGGVRISETAIDLGVCLAVASSFYGRSLKADTVLVGEVGLSGEIRAVRGIDRRLAEARNLGFLCCLIPEANLRESHLSEWESLSLLGLRNLQECLDYFSLR
jgi:hypothetical protein